MIGQLLRPLQVAARGFLRRAGLMAVAGLIGAVGCGFVVYAAFAALRLVFGPELAALFVGLALLAMAGVLAGSAADRGQVGVQKPAEPATGPPPPCDPVSMAVFTAAFVLGRRLMDRRRD